MYHNCHKINFKQKKNKCFQNIVTVFSNHEEIKKDLQRTIKIKLFIDKYNWEGIICPSEKNDWKNLNKNNLTIALKDLHAKKEKIYLAYVSKHNSNREKQVILLMLPKREGWSCLTVKTINIIQRNKVQTTGWLLLYEWPSFLYSKKQTLIW